MKHSFSSRPPSPFQWSERYVLGDPGVDDQHRQLLELAGLLHAALLSGRGADVVSAALQALGEYVDIHFRDEEELFVRIGSPDTAAHRAQHTALRQEVAELDRDLEYGFDALPDKLVGWVEHRLVPHMMVDDQRALQSARQRPFGYGGGR